MKKEIRVYMVDVTMQVFDSSPARWSGEEFISEAEKQGSVYTLEYFEKEWNSANIKLHAFIRFIEVENTEDFTPHLISVNKVELASNLANNYLIAEFITPSKNNDFNPLYKYEEDLFIEDDNENMVYKDEVQEIFDDRYDYYITMIDECEEQ